MRIIAGTARGRKLVAPRGWEGRPTLDRVRESLFNILAPRLANCRFLDLYAGTGANGMEALSRGASTAVFIESDPQATSAITRNLAHMGLATGATVVCDKLPQALSRLENHAPFDIVFADPPYRFTDYGALLAEIGRNALADADGVVVLEHAAQVSLPDEEGGFARSRAAQYGDVCLAFYS